MTDLERLLLEEIPTGRFGRPAKPARSPDGPGAPDPHADAHRAALAEAARPRRRTAA